MKKRQGQGWGAGEQAEQHYLVQPRHLAGGGNLQHVAAFLHASGWRDKSKPERLLLESPDRTIRIAYDPHVLPGGWVIQGTATAHQDEWWATLGQQTPVEIIAGLTDAVTQPRSAHAPNVWAPLLEQGWHAPDDADHVTTVSADSTAWVRYQQSQPGEAVWLAGATDEHGNGWTAQLASSTPMHLVEAFSTALASPDPVMRPLGRVPHSSRIQTTSVSVLPSQLRAWQQARIAAARAATWARNSVRGPRPRAANPPAHAGSARARR